MGGTPHQHAAHGAGGDLLYARLPSPSNFAAELARYAPGCGSPTPVVGTSSMMPCGAHLHGKPYLCPHCQANAISEVLLASLWNP